MKKTICLLTAALIVLSLSSCKEKNDNDLSADNTITTVTELTTQATPSEIVIPKAETLSFSPPVPPEVIGSITQGVKIDLSDFDSVSGPVGSKVLTFKKKGDKVSTIVLPNEAHGGVINYDYYNTEVGILDCETGEFKGGVTEFLSQDLYYEISYGLDGRYAYLHYINTPAPYDSESFDYSLIQVDMINATTKKYNFTSKSLGARVVPLGDDSVLILYYNSITYDDESIRQDLIYDVLNLSTGEVKNFSVYPFFGGAAGNGSVSPDLATQSNNTPSDYEYLFFRTASEDKVYFTSFKKQDSKEYYSIKIYNTKMELVEDILVYTNDDYSDNSWRSLSDSLSIDGERIYYVISEPIYGGWEITYVFEKGNNGYSKKVLEYDGLLNLRLSESMTSNKPANSFSEVSAYKINDKISLVLKDIYNTIVLDDNNNYLHELDIIIPIEIDNLNLIESIYGDYLSVTMDYYSGNMIVLGVDDNNNDVYYYLSNDYIQSLLKF